MWGVGVVVGEPRPPGKRLYCSKHFKTAERRGVGDEARGRPGWTWAAWLSCHVALSRSPPPLELPQGPSSLCGLATSPSPGQVFAVCETRMVTSTVNLETATQGASLTWRFTSQATRPCVGFVKGSEEVRSPRATSCPLWSVVPLPGRGSALRELWPLSESTRPGPIPQGSPRGQVPRAPRHTGTEGLLSSVLEPQSHRVPGWTGPARRARCQHPSSACSPFGGYAKVCQCPPFNKYVYIF